MDTDALVKVTKGSLKEFLAQEFEVLLPPEVVAECVTEGKAGRHPDAFLVEINIEKGLLAVRETRREPRSEAVLADLGISGGEADTLRLYWQKDADLVVSDDGRFLRYLRDLGIPSSPPAMLLATLVRSGRLELAEARDLLANLAPFISSEERLVALSAMEGR